MNRTLVIGDIHGCSRALETLLREVKPNPDDVLITLGDYVDRGPDTRGVMDRLIGLESETQLVPLIGNHEMLFLREWKDDCLTGPWMNVGGRETLESYAGDREISWDHVSEEHRTFLAERCQRYHETDTHFFVHGGVDPRLPLKDQSDECLLWKRFEESEPHSSGKTMVCGHSAQRSGLPLRTPGCVCIDTWAYGQGWLSCLIIEFGLIVQANQKGHTRRFSLDHTPMMG